MPLKADDVAFLAYQGCSNRDIGRYLGCCHRTIKDRFGPVLVRARELRQARIRHDVSMTLEAPRGSFTPMLDWLETDAAGRVQDRCEARFETLRGPEAG